MKYFFRLISLGISLLLLVPSIYSQNITWQKDVKKVGNNIHKVEWIIDALKNKPQYSNFYLEMLEYGKTLSNEINIDSLKGKIYFSYGQYYTQIGNISEAWKNYQTSKIFFLRSKNYGQVNRIVNSQCVLLIMQNLSDSMIFMIDKNRKFIEISNNIKAKINSTNFYAIGMAEIGNIDTAHFLFQKALEAARNINDSELISAILLNIGKYHTNLDSSIASYKKAAMYINPNSNKFPELIMKIGYKYNSSEALKDSCLFYYLLAEKCIDKMNPIYKIQLETLIADYFQSRNEHNLALPFFIKASKYAEGMQGQTRNLSINNLALAYYYTNKVDSANFYITQYKKAIENTGDDYQWLLYWQSIASIESGNRDSCSVNVIKSIDKAISYCVKLNSTRHAITLIESVSNCLNNKNEQSNIEIGIAKNVLKNCSLLYETFLVENNLSSFSIFLKSYAQLEKKYGDSKHAFFLYDKLTKILNQMINENYLKGKGESLIKYKSELKDAEIALLTERDNANQSRTLFIIIGLIFAAVASIIIFVLYRRENKIRREVNKRNHKIEQLLKEIHHRVKNNLQIVSSFINIQLDNVIEHSGKSALNDTSNRIMALASLHQSLYIQNDFSNIEMKKYLNDVIQNISDGNSKEIDLETNFDNILLDIDRAISIGLAVNELVTNSIKHAFPNYKGKIDISFLFEQNKSNCVLIVKDNGKGFNFKQQNINSIGFGLVEDIAQTQLKGFIETFNEGGAVVKIKFKI